MRQDVGIRPFFMSHGDRHQQCYVGVLRRPCRLSVVRFESPWKLFVFPFPHTTADVALANQMPPKKHEYPHSRKTLIACLYHKSSASHYDGKNESDLQDHTHRIRRTRGAFLRGAENPINGCYRKNAKDPMVYPCSKAFIGHICANFQAPINSEDRNAFRFK